MMPNTRRKNEWGWCGGRSEEMKGKKIKSRRAITTLKTTKRTRNMSGAIMEKAAPCHCFRPSANQLCCTAN